MGIEINIAMVDPPTLVVSRPSLSLPLLPQFEPGLQQSWLPVVPKIISQPMLRDTNGRPMDAYNFVGFERSGLDILVDLSARVGAVCSGLG